MSVERRFGKYVVLQRIGAGGMAEVFKCRLTGIGGFDKLVVVKVIRSDLLQEPEFVRMFLDEARVSAFLNHPNIIQVFEIDEIEGSPYIAMEYVRGPTLGAMLRRARATQRLNVGHAAQILSDVCLGLHHAHTARDAEGEPLNIVHRDVSPQNVLVSYEGVPKLLDFGVARARGRQTNTEAGTLKGKLRYMAPEQLMGGQLDQRADVFSAGMCLYEACTGSPPYGTKTDPEVIRDIAKGTTGLPEQFPPGFPPELQGIIRWAAEPVLAQRCPSCYDLHAALEKFLSSGDHASSAKHVAAWIAELFPDSTEMSLPGGYGSSYSSSGARDGRRTPRPAPTSATTPEDLIEVVESLTPVEKPRRRRRNAAIAAGAIAAALLVGLLVWRPWKGARPEAPVQAAAEPAAPAGAPRDDEAVRLYVEEIEQMAKARRYGPALELLAKARALSAQDPALNIQLAKLADSLERDALIARAQKLLEAGDAAGAIEAAKQVLERTPENPEAPKIIADAKALQQPKVAVESPAVRNKPARMGRLTITSDPPGYVFLDDEPIGRTPIRGRSVREGRHVVQVRVEGFAAFDKSVQVASGREVMVAAHLTAAPRKRLAAADIGEASDRDRSPPPAAPAPAPTAPQPAAEERVEPPPTPAPPPAPAAAPPAPPPAPAVEAKPPAPASTTTAPPPAPAAPQVRQPKVPARHTVRSTKELVRAFQIIENEIMAAGVPASIAKDVTYPLSQELGRRIGPSEPVELYPRAVYFYVVEQASKRKSQSAISEGLRSAQLSGALKAAADR